MLFLVRFSISRLETCVFRLKTCISKLEIHISRLEIQIFMGMADFHAACMALPVLHRHILARIALP